MEEIVRLLATEIEEIYKTMQQNDNLFYFTLFVAIMQMLKQINNLPPEQRNTFIDSCITWGNEQLEKLKEK